jgi:hypothetical protein
MTVVIFLVLLDLGKKSSFVDRHWIVELMVGYFKPIGA